MNGMQEKLVFLKQNTWEKCHEISFSEIQKVDLVEKRVKLFIKIIKILVKVIGIIRPRRQISFPKTKIQFLV